MNNSRHEYFTPAYYFIDILTFSKSKILCKIKVLKILFNSQNIINFACCVYNVVLCTRSTYVLSIFATHYL